LLNQHQAAEQDGLIKPRIHEMKTDIYLHFAVRLVGSGLLAVSLTASHGQPHPTVISAVPRLGVDD
jgi:hypothetical protein